MATIAELQQRLVNLDQERRRLRQLADLNGPLQREIEALRARIPTITDPLERQRAQARLDQAEEEITRYQVRLAEIFDEQQEINLAIWRLEATATKIEPPPAQPIDQQVSNQTGGGPATPPPTFTPGPTNAQAPRTLEDGGGSRGTDAATRTTQQTQTVGSNSAAPVLPSETGVKLPPPPTLPGTANTTGTGAARPGAAAGEDTGAQLPPTTQTKPPSVTGGLSVDSKITPQPNILDRFANYTYEAGVYLMSDEQYRIYQRTGKRTVTGYNLLFQTGGAPDNQGGAPTSVAQAPQQAGAPTQPSSTVGRNPNFPLDYYIDSITFENYLPGKSVQSAHSVKKLKFTVVEPANISLIDNIFKAVQEIKPTNASGNINYASAFYLMVIRFYGYDQNGVIQKVGAANPVTGQSDPNAVIEKFIPFKIAHINWSVSGKLVTYEFDCAPVEQMIAGGTRRGTVTADVELSGGTVRELLAGGVIYSGATATPDSPGASTTPTSTQIDAESARLNRQAGNAPPTATAAPPKATSAPSRTAIKQGLMEAMNQFQQQLVKDGVYEVADEYALEFAPGAEAIADATITKPGEKTNKSQTPVGPAPSQQPSVASPDKQAMIAQARNQTIVAGTQLVQAIDIVVRNSNFITDQAQVVIREDNSQSSPNPRSQKKGVNWYNITFRAEPIKYDNKRNDFAYRVTYIINVFPMQDFLSLYFPEPIFRGLHKSYPYWFTGINTSVLDYTASFNKLYNLTVTASTADFDALANIRKKYTSNMRDMAFFQYQARSTESQQNAQGKTNELAANAAEYLYNPSDNGNAKIRILGDPAWIAQASFTGGISAETFSYSPFLPDGTINFDSNDVLFEILWQRPEDYDLGTGLADPYQRTSKLYGDRQPRQSVVYRAVSVESEFRLGRFEQTVNGTLYLFPLPDGSNTAPTASQGTQSEGNQGEELARQNFAQQQTQASLVNRANAASPSAVTQAATQTAQITQAAGAAQAAVGAVTRGVADGAGRITNVATIPGLTESARITGYGLPGALPAPGVAAVNIMSSVGSTNRTPGVGLPQVLPSLPATPPSSNSGTVGQISSNITARDIAEAERIQRETGVDAITAQQVANNRLINEKLSSVFGTLRAPQSMSRET